MYDFLHEKKRKKIIKPYLKTKRHRKSLFLNTQNNCLHMCTRIARFKHPRNFLKKKTIKRKRLKILH